MRKLQISLFILFVFALMSCFKDKGSYYYEELNPPNWNIKVDEQLLYVTAKGGIDVTIDGTGSFNWGEMDSLKRSQEVSYHWTWNDIVFCEKLKETIPTSELMRRLGLTEYPKEPLLSYFSVVEKKTGVEYSLRVRMIVIPPVSEGDFVIYAEQEGNPNQGRLIPMVYNFRAKEGKDADRFDLKMERARDVLGTPKKLVYAQALNVSPFGSMTTITKEGDAIVYNASTLERKWDIKEQFVDDIVPEQLKVVDIRYQETSSREPSFTWLATADGRVFTRQKGKYFLGGRFLNKPYFLDDKGYEITAFGHTLWGITNIPMYDKKNRRVLVGTSLPFWETNTYRSFMDILESPVYKGEMPVSQMPQGTEVLFMTNIFPHYNWYQDGRNAWFEYLYKEGDGTVKIGKFAIDNEKRVLKDVSGDYQQLYTITGHHFDEETLFITSASYRYFFETTKTPPYFRASPHIENTLFTEGEKISAYDHRGVVTPISENGYFSEIKSKITAWTYDTQTYGTYKHLIIGCENGDIFIYDTEDLFKPFLVKKYNVGARVASIKQISQNRTTLDIY